MEKEDFTIKIIKYIIKATFKMEYQNLKMPFGFLLMDHILQVSSMESLKKGNQLHKINNTQSMMDNGKMAKLTEEGRLYIVMGQFIKDNSNKEDRMVKENKRNQYKQIHKNIL